MSLVGGWSVASYGYDSSPTMEVHDFGFLTELLRVLIASHKNTHNKAFKAIKIK